MRIFTAGRLLAGAAVMLAAAPLATISFAGSASAVSFPTAGVVCTHLHGQASTLTAKLKGCTAAPTGGTGAIVNFQPTGGNVTWANGTTTDFSSTATNPATGCPSGSLLFKITGSVTGGTNPSTPVGQAVKMKICANQTTGALTNETGTNVKF
jgi:hypothetical protein